MDNNTRDIDNRKIKPRLLIIIGYIISFTLTGIGLYFFLFVDGYIALNFLSIALTLMFVTFLQSSSRS